MNSLAQILSSVLRRAGCTLIPRFSSAPRGKGKGNFNNVRDIGPMPQSLQAINDIRTPLEIDPESIHQEIRIGGEHNRINDNSPPKIRVIARSFARLLLIMAFFSGTNSFAYDEEIAPEWQVDAHGQFYRNPSLSAIQGDILGRLEQPPHPCGVPKYFAGPVDTSSGIFTISFTFTNICTNVSDSGTLVYGGNRGCPIWTPSYAYDKSRDICWRNSTVIQVYDVSKAPDPDDCVKNPINPSIGNKRQIATDYLSSGSSSLIFQRTYNSASQLGAKWTHTYQRTLRVVSIYGQSTAYVSRPDGSTHTFTLISSGQWRSQSDVNATLSTNSGHAGTYVSKDDDHIERFDIDGRLISIIDRAGVIQNLTYSSASTASTIAPIPGLLINVTDAFGRTLNFTYDVSARLRSMTDPSGSQYVYG